MHFGISSLNKASFYLNNPCNVCDPRRIGAKGGTMANSEDRSFKTVQEIGRINAFFPILQQLGNRWAASRPWEGRVIALNMHLTTLTAYLRIDLGGGKFIVTAANPATTDPATDFLRGQGLDVYTGGDMKNRHLKRSNTNRSFWLMWVLAYKYTIG